MIKTTTGYWVNGFTADIDIVNAFQWLIQNSAIHVPYAEYSEDKSMITIPSWIKTSAGYWIDNRITDVHQDSLEFIILCNAGYAVEVFVYCHSLDNSTVDLRTN